MDPAKKLLSSIRRGENESAKSTLADLYLCKALDILAPTLLRYSAKHGNSEVTEFLLSKGCNVDTQDSMGRTALMRAVMGEHHKVVQVLLEAGADISTLLNSEKKSALHMVCAEHKLTFEFRSLLMENFRKECTSSEEAAEKLINAEAHLYMAVFTKDAKVIEYMLNHGFSSDSKIPGAQITALHIAVMLEHVEMVRVLFKYGADADASDLMGYSPLFYVYRHDKNHSAERVQVLRLLLDHSASLLKVSQAGNTLRYGSADAVRVVLSSLDFVAENQLADNQVLHSLALNTEPGVADELRLYMDKCNVNVLNCGGLNALQLSAIYGNCAMVKLLLEYKINVNYAVRNTGRTALYYAYARSMPKMEEQYDQCVELLLYHGADPQFVINDDNDEERTVFDLVLKNKSKRLKSVIAQLAVLELTGMPITETTMEKINAKTKFRKYHEKCRKFLGQEIEGSVTVFKLITGTERILEKYAGNEDLLLKLQRIANQQSVRCCFTYYCNFLTKRLTKEIQRRRLADIASGVLCLTLQDRVDPKHIVVERLIEYFKDEDLRRLCQV